MNFNDNPTEAAFRQSVREWLTANAPQNWKDEFKKGFAHALATGKAWQAKRAEAGWACIHWPQKYGGRGASLIEQAIWEQEEGELGRLSGFFFIGQQMAGTTLMVYGSEEQKNRYLPPMASGKEIWCQLFSEPGAGSDLAGLRTKAVREGDDWIINGQKIWTSGAHYSDYGILVTRSDFNAPKHLGLTYFFVDMKSPGVEVKPIKQINGNADFNEVYFNDVRIPDSQRLGRVGEGWKVALTTLMNERAGIGSFYKSNFKQMLAELQNMTIEGLPALADKAVRAQMADFYVSMSGVRNINFRMMSDLSKGKHPGPESSVSKLIIAKQQQEEAAFMMDMQDYAGILAASADEEDTAQQGYFQHWYFSSPALRIAGGSDEILRNILAERVLKLPADIRVDKDLPFTEIPSGV
jgi:alkylation response protein AidB-like acyl-CoA dehydrogenase